MRTQEIEKKISTPPPLRNEKEDQDSVLTRSGVIQRTNFQREKIWPPATQRKCKAKCERIYKSRRYA